MQIHVGIFQAEVARGRAGRIIVADGIRPEQQGGIVADAPIALANGLADRERDNV